MIAVVNKDRGLVVCERGIACAWFMSQDRHDHNKHECFSDSGFYRAKPIDWKQNGRATVPQDVLSCQISRARSGVTSASDRTC